MLLFILPSILPAFSQGFDNIWLLGYDNAPQPLAEGIVLDFNNGNPNIFNVQRKMSFRQTCASICDSSGNLLFYTNGVFIADATNDTMINGADLNPSLYTTSWSPYGLKIAQGDLILPAPSSNNLYYLFHETIEYSPTRASCLYKSVIDMSQNGGLGAVISKNDTLIPDTILIGEITAVKHGNGRDWWLVSHKWNSNLFYTFLITPTGIQGPFSQQIGSVSQVASHQVCFSPDGTKYARVTFDVDLEVMDFDRCTGLFSNPLQISLNDSAFARGVAFSASSKYLYVSSTLYVYQFDVTSSNIAATKNTVAVFDTFSDPSPPFYAYFYLAQLAPDGKIYLNTSNGTSYLHVINNPDNGGLGCNLQQHSLYLGTYNAFSIPNYPTLNLGSKIGSGCDTLTSIGNVQVANSKNELKVFYHSAWQKAFINAQHLKGTTYVLTVIDVMGRIVFKEKSKLQPPYFTKDLDCGRFGNGMYIITLKTNREILSTKFIKN